MNLPRNIQKALGIGPLQKLHHLRVFLNRWLFLENWFPHVPLSLAMAVLGLLQLAPAAEEALGTSLFSGHLSAALHNYKYSGIHNMPQVALGSTMVLMSVGLLFRSRLAWFIAIMVTSTSLVLAGMPRSTSPYTGMGYNILFLVLLLLSRRRFNKSSLAAATLFALGSAILLLTYAVIGSYELGQDFSPPIEDFVTAFYFSVVTMSTVGYGDFIPKSPQAKFFVISIIVLGISLFATSLSAILAPIINRRMRLLIQPKGAVMNHVNHYVIVGDSSLARNSFRELTARNQPVTFIFQHPPEDGMYQDTDVIIGDGTDLEVLRRAGADKAKAVLALGTDDSENAFVVLAVKELAGAAKTVAAVNDARNMPRVRRVQPDLVIAPQVLGGELLAMALSGEKVEGDELLARFLHFR